MCQGSWRQDRALDGRILYLTKRQGALEISVLYLLFLLEQPLAHASFRCLSSVTSRMCR